MPIASAMRAKRRPIAPRPITPTVRPLELDALVRRLVPVAGVHARVERARPTWRRPAAAPAPARRPRRRSRRPRRRPRCRAPRPRPCRSCRCRCRAWRSPSGVGAASIARGADLAVAHDDRDRVVPLAQRDDVVLGRRLAGVDDVEVAEQRQRLRREVGAGDEERRASSRSQRLSFLDARRRRAARRRASRRRSALRLLMSAMRCGLGGDLLGGERQHRGRLLALDHGHAVGVADDQVAGMDADAADRDRMVRGGRERTWSGRSG